VTSYANSGPKFIGANTFFFSIISAWFTRYRLLFMYSTWVTEWIIASLFDHNVATW
jgi:hypothetical protein